MATRPDYPIIIFWSDEDECFVADIPDLFPCSVFGDTPQDALTEILVAKEAVLETMQEDGQPFPPPTIGPAIVSAARELGTPAPR
jgi:predicted RNase H-like HicB family nuclease